MKKLNRIGLLAFDKRKAILDRILALMNDPRLSFVEFYTLKGLPVPKHPRITLLEEKLFLKKIDAAVSFGGDGTFISAARLIREASIPLAGVNMGTLGFLTEVAADNAPDILSRLFHGEYTLEKRMSFDITLVRKDKTLCQDACLNDVVLKGIKLTRFFMSQANSAVSAYHADGLILSTPTGSTAYSLAAGGPIVDPTLDCVIVTPLCSHSLTQKPVVTGIRKPLTVRMDNLSAPADLIIDGRRSIPLKAGDTICISRSKHTTTMLKPHGTNYFDILRRKLNWG